MSDQNAIPLVDTAKVDKLTAEWKQALGDFGTSTAAHKAAADALDRCQKTCAETAKDLAEKQAAMNAKKEALKTCLDSVQV